MMKYNKEKVKKKRKQFHKNFTKQLISDGVRLVPGLNQLDKAKEKTELQEKESKAARKQDAIHDKVNDLTRNMDIVAKSSAIFSQKPSLKQIDELHKMLNDTTRKNPDFEIEFVRENGVSIMQISPKQKEINFTGTFAFNKKKMEGFKDFKKWIDFNIKQGREIEFTEEELKKFVVDNPQMAELMEDYSHAKLIIKPQIHGKKLKVDLSVRNSDFTIPHVELGCIYRDENQLTLMTTNLPFKLVFIHNFKDKKEEVKFTPSKENKLESHVLMHEFLCELSTHKEFSIMRNGREIQRLGIEELNYNKDYVSILKKMLRVDKQFNVGFGCPPPTIDKEEVSKINVLHDFLNTGKMKLILKEGVLIVPSESIPQLIKQQEEKGFVANLPTLLNDHSITIQDKEIKLGDGKATIPKAKILNNVEELKQAMSANPTVKVRTVPLDGGELEFTFS